MLKWLDLVTGEHHRALCRQYEVRLAVADARVRDAEARVDQERESRNGLEHQLIENIFPPRRQIVRTGSPAEPRRRVVDVPIDPNDNEAIIRQAALETGSRNATFVQARAQQIKDRLIRGERLTRPKLVEDPPGPPNQDEVNRIIEQAAAEGEAAGRATVQAEKAS